ncbi:MAG: glycosyltransferase [Planctomycetota bacterium]
MTETVEPSSQAGSEPTSEPNPAPVADETPGPAVLDPDVTIVFPVQTPKAELDDVISALGGALERLGYSWECILVFDGIKGALWERATELQASSRDQIRTIALHKPFGESVCLSSAFEHSQGQLILTTPPYVQVDPDELEKVTSAIEDGADFVTTVRKPRVDSMLNQLQSFAFNWLVRKVVGARFHDLNSTLRIMRREVLEQVTIYGSMYRYLPAVAYRQGFRVDEVDMRHVAEWGSTSVFGPGIYLRRALDVLGLMFLARFTHKPLRFFGTLGGSSMFVGFVLVLSQVVRHFVSEGSFSLYQSPFFLVGVLLGVLGVQIVGFGLVGEIIIFTQARNVREYRIERIYE